jgi:replicative DNA helicase
MVNASSSPLEIRSIVDVAQEEAQYIDDRRKGIIKSLKTPWKKYNDISMGGVEWHTIHTIGGMSGSGKTAILNQLESGVCELNPDAEFNVLSFNFEMLARNLVGRKMSKELNITVQNLHSGIEGSPLSDADYQRVLDSQQTVTQYPIFYVDTAGTVEEMMQTIMAFHRQHPDKGIFMTLDHTLLVNGTASEVERVVLVNLVKALKAGIKYFKSVGVNFACVILTQLNRAIEEQDRCSEPGSHNFPKKKDIFGGDALFQMSDLVLVTMNPAQNGMSVYGANKWPTKGFLYWHFLKVREGEPVIACMTNKLAINTVEDYTPSTQLNLNN